MKEHLIVSVIEDSPADKAGICKGDILISLNGKEIIDIFDYDFIEELRDTLKWKVIERVDRARKDYTIMIDESHKFYLDTTAKEVHYGECVLPAYWYKDDISQKEMDETLLRYKLIWEKLNFGDIHYPLLEDWHPLSSWKEEYSKETLCKMEKALEAGSNADELSLYYLYSRRAYISEINRVYPDKIKQILSISNRVDSEDKRTADLSLLLYDDSKCSVRVGTDKYGKYCSTTALSRPGFPLFTVRDGELIQKTVFD